MKKKEKTIKTELEIRDKIKNIEDAFGHILNIPNATVFANAPRALMQAEAQSKLSVLYWCVGEIRPTYACDLS